MATFPVSTKSSLTQRLNSHARNHWPQLKRVITRFRGPFAYIDGQLPTGEVLPLCRLRYTGSASRWGFALYRASHDDYKNNILPNGWPTGSCEEALDCACELYLSTNWPTPPNFQS